MVGVSAGQVSETQPLSNSHSQLLLEVVVVGFGWFLAAFSPYKNADMVFDFCLQQAQRSLLDPQ